MRKIGAVLFVLALPLFYPVFSRADTIFYPDSGVTGKEIDSILENNKPGPQENIKSTLVHETDNVSIHIVQIRSKEKPHVHKTHDLIVSLKKGHGKLYLGNSVITMNEGDTAFIPRGTTHYFENTNEDVAAGIGVFVPAYDGTDTVVVDEKIQ